MSDSDSDNGTNSKIKTFANIIISFIGAGILGLPYAFKEAGILEGILVMTIVGFVSVKAMLLLIDCKDKIMYGSLVPLPGSAASGDRSFKLHIDYGELGYSAMGAPGKMLVDAAIIVSQVGFTCAYLIFISENLYSIYPGLPKLAYTAVLLIPLWFLTNLRHLKSLAPFSIFANFANIFAYTIVFYFDLDHIHLINLHVNSFSVQGLPFFLGISIYCYEGAGMVLSLEQSVIKEMRGVFRNIFKLALSCTTTLYIVFGVLGYLSFGPDTKPIITLNLPDGPFPLIVKTCLCISLFFTYPIMMFPVSEILDKRLLGKENPKSAISSNQPSNFTKGCVIRSVLVLVTGIVVAIIPNFSTLMALVGSSCCTLLAFILPAVFHLKLFKKELSNFNLCLDIFLIALGIVGTIIGTQDALSRVFKTNKTTSLIHALNHSSTDSTLTSASHFHSMPTRPQLHHS